MQGRHVVQPCMSMRRTLVLTTGRSVVSGPTVSAEIKGARKRRIRLPRGICRRRGAQPRSTRAIPETNHRRAPGHSNTRLSPGSRSAGRHRHEVGADKLLAMRLFPRQVTPFKHPRAECCEAET